jgi:hypothetical protein
VRLRFEKARDFSDATRFRQGEAPVPRAAGLSARRDPGADLAIAAPMEMRSRRKADFLKIQ